MKAWLLFVLLLLSGQAFALDDLRSAVAREVRDPQRAAQATALVDELTQLLAEAHGATDARRDAMLMQVLDIYQRMKAVISAGEWEGLPRVLAADDAAIQELLGFMQTYDAQPGDLQPLLQRLRK